MAVLPRCHKLWRSHNWLLFCCVSVLCCTLQVYVHTNNHAGYYPGAKTIDLKLLFDPEVSMAALQAPGPSLSCARIHFWR